MNFLLVHLGNVLPDYLIDNVRQIRLWNPTTKITLILSDCLVDDNIINIFKEYSVDLINPYDIKWSENHEHFSDKFHYYNEGFRDGFHKSTIERFFYLDSFLQQAKLTNVIHVENDVLIYFKFETFLPKFNNYKLASCFDSRDRCVPGFFFIRESLYLDNMCRYIAQKMDNFVVDMEIINHYREDCTQIKKLPLNFDGDPFYTDGFANFKSIFDGAAIGQFLGGIDPRNSGGISTVGYISPDAGYKVNNWKIRDTRIDGKRVFYVESGDKNIRINNLHIHCKDLKKFM